MVCVGPNISKTIILGQFSVIIATFERLKGKVGQNKNVLKKIGRSVGHVFSDIL